MSEHAWTSEHIAALVAGGLDAAEAERAEAHVRECAECAAALRDARALDRGLAALFTPARPAPTLEDRLIQTLRAPQKSVYFSRSSRARGWQRKLALGIAASVGLGITGAGLSVLAGDNGLPMPGDGGVSLRERLHGLESTVASDRAEFRLGADLKEVMDSSTLYSTDRRESNEQLLDRPRSEIHTRFGRGLVVDPETKARESFSFHVGSDAKESELRSKLSFGFGLDPNMPSDYVDRIEGWDTPAKKAPNDPIGNSDVPGTTPPPLRGFGPVDNREDVTKSSGFGRKLGGMNATTHLSVTPSDGPTNGSTAIRYFKPTTTRSIPVTETKSVRRSDDPVGNKLPKTDESGKLFTPALVEGQPKPNTPPPAPEAGVLRKIIRSGGIEFEIDAFDTASATVISLVDKIKGGFVATINSEKLPNGKVKGSIVVRVPPDKLDQFVLDLRRELGKTGELKGQRIGSQDITKSYYDTESRLKAARYMEQRLLTMIKEGKGDIKQLLEAEKELGVWRTKIDEMEGEKRYYDNQVSLSTLTITLAEKEIRAAAGLTESERVQTGIEVEDVEQAHRDALAAVTEAKGRVTRSEVKQLAAGQFNATLNFEVAPEQAGPLRDRLKQLGRTARLEVDRVQQAEGGTPQRDSKVKRGDTQFFVQFYNLANIAPRETTTVQLAAPDVAAAYRSLVDAVVRAKGRIITSKLDENDRQNVSAQLDFEIKRAEEGALQTAMAAGGETIARNVNRAADTENVTDAKLLYRLTLLSAARLRPREIVSLGIEVENVDAALATFTANVAEAKGRVIDSNIGRQANGKVSAGILIDVPLSAAPALTQKLMSVGVVKAERRVRDAQAPDGQYATARIEVVVATKDLIVPKDEGLGTQVRSGLSYGAKFLLVSLSWLIVGLCFVLPWAVVGYGAYRIGRWLFRSPAAAPTPAAPSPPAA